MGGLAHPNSRAITRTPMDRAACLPWTIRRKAWPEVAPHVWQQTEPIKATVRFGRLWTVHDHDWQARLTTVAAARQLTICTLAAVPDDGLAYALICWTEPPRLINGRFAGRS